jgi:hypothetical protein
MAGVAFLTRGYLSQQTSFTLTSHKGPQLMRHSLFIKRYQGKKKVEKRKGIGCLHFIQNFLVLKDRDMVS